MTLTQQAPIDVAATPELPWWVVVARLAFDDADSLFIIQAANGQDAIHEAERQRRCGGDEYDDREFYLDYVVRCDSRPELVMDNA